jgi:copper transport protein
VLAVGGVVLLLVAQAAEASGRGIGNAIGLTFDVATGTRTGELTLWRLGALALAAVLALAARHPRERLAAVASVPAVGAMVVTSMASHAWTVEPRSVALASDIAHQVAVGVWIGGLVALVAALPITEARQRLAGRFSVTATAAIVVVALTGVVSGFLQIDVLEGLWETGYGRTLIAKVVVFAGVGALGWYNRQRLVPIVDWVAPRLVRVGRVEVGLAAVVIALTAVLVDLPPARVSVDRPFTTSVRADELTLQLDVVPARTGPNDMHLYFFGAGNEPVTIDAVEIAAAFGDVPPRNLEVTPITPNHVSAYGATLNQAGTWQIGVTAVTAGAPTTFEIEVPIR